MKKWMLALFALALLALGNAAQSGPGSDVLQFKYNMFACRGGAIVSLVEYGAGHTNLSSNGTGTQIQDDLAMLQGYAQQGDSAGFNSFVRGTFKNDVKNAVMYIKDAKKEMIKDKGNKQEMQDYFVQTIDTRNACISSAAMDFARNSVGDMEARVANMDATISKLGNKSVNVSGLQRISSEAHANLQKMKDAISTGSGTGVVDTFKEIREEHLHIWARFHIEKLRQITSVVQVEATSKGYGSDIDQINALLNDAAGKVAPGRPYSPGEFDEVKKDLVDASAKLRDLLVKIRGA